MSPVDNSPEGLPRKLPDVQKLVQASGLTERTQVEQQYIKEVYDAYPDFFRALQSDTHGLTRESSGGSDSLWMSLHGIKDDRLVRTAYQLTGIEFHAPGRGWKDPSRLPWQHEGELNRAIQLHVDYTDKKTRSQTLRFDPFSHMDLLHGAVEARINEIVAGVRTPPGEPSFPALPK